MDEYIIHDGQYSYSSVSQYWKCPKAYDYRYQQKLKRIHAYEARDPLLLGSTVHLGMQFDLKTASKFYHDHFCILDDYQVNEMIKVEHWITKGHELLLEFDILHKEYEISTPEYRGTVDLIVDNNDGTVDIIDFKYCAESSVEHYIHSEQLHLYKYFLELTTEYKVRDLKFVIFPKLFTRQKDGEDLYSFRKRMMIDLEKMTYKIIRIEYLEDMMGLFAKKIRTLQSDNKFEPNRGENCKYCVYRRVCNGKDDYNMLIPKNEPVEIGIDGVNVLWIYGPSFVGKTTGIDGYGNNPGFPNPLNMNTDGNTKMVKMPRLKIENKVDVTGRKKTTTLAWDIFKAAADELKTTDEGYETLVLDLTEDLFEFCRLFIYDRDQIEHEADNSMKYYDIVRTEFLSTIRDLKSIKGLKWIILISHEDHSKDIMKRSGGSITAIKPNINDKVARKLAGMSSAVARVMVNDDNSRVLNFKTDNVIFGGGRLDIKDAEIPWTYEAVQELFDSATHRKQQQVEGKVVEEPKPEPKNGRASRATKPVEEPKVEEVKVEEPKVETPVEEPKPRTRKSRGQKATDEHDEAHPMPTEDGIPIDVNLSVNEPDDKIRYAYHPESGAYFTIEPGDTLGDGADASMCEIISKERYDEAMAEQAKRDEEMAQANEEPTVEEPKPEEAPRRRRRRS